MTKQNVHKSTQRRTDGYTYANLVKLFILPNAQMSMPLEDFIETERFKQYLEGDELLSPAAWLQCFAVELVLNKQGILLTEPALNAHGYFKRHTIGITYDLINQLVWCLDHESQQEDFVPNQGFKGTWLLKLAQEPTIEQQCMFKSKKQKIELQKIAEWSKAFYYEPNGPGKHNWADRIMDDINHYTQYLEETINLKVYENWINK